MNRAAAFSNKLLSAREPFQLSEKLRTSSVALILACGRHSSPHTPPNLELTRKFVMNLTI